MIPSELCIKAYKNTRFCIFQIVIASRGHLTFPVRQFLRPHEGVRFWHLEWVVELMPRLYIYASCNRIPWPSMPQFSFHFNFFQKYMHTYLNLNYYEKQTRTFEVWHPATYSYPHCRRYLTRRIFLHEHAVKERSSEQLVLLWAFYF